MSRTRDKFPSEQKLLQTYLEAVDKMPTAPPPILLPENDPLRMQCLCGKWKERTSMPVRNTGLVPFRDTICKGCHNKDNKDWATIVCYRCRGVVGKVEPGKDKDGFVFRRGGFYHVARCPACCENIIRTEIVERTLWVKNNLRTTPVYSTPTK